MIFNEFQDIYQQVARQLGHWAQATVRLSRLEELAAPSAWKGLDQYLNTTLINSLQKGLKTLEQKSMVLQHQMQTITTVNEIKALQIQVDMFKTNYLQTETLLDFYADAINTRTNPDMASLMRACDRIAYTSMEMILKPLGKKTPPVLTYISKGLGASILKEGLTLWDGKTRSPVAAIKVVRHNLYRPTALIHESGHQIAHILKWNEELAEVLYGKLEDISIELAELWSGWSSEIAADTFAFVHTGYASIAGLCDVVSGTNAFVFRYQPGDPHPISYLRLLLGIQMCRLCFGKGPWDQMERVWTQKYNLQNASPQVQKLITQSIPLLNNIAQWCLQTPLKAFNYKSIVYWINPNHVNPERLLELNASAGYSLHTSAYWIHKESIRLLALGGYAIATAPQHVPQLLEQQRKWMLKLGTGLHAA